MSTGGITAWARREEAIHGEIKETKSNSVNLKKKKKEAFLTHVMHTQLVRWAHTHSLALDLLWFLPAFAHPQQNMLQKCCKNILWSVQGQGTIKWSLPCLISHSFCSSQTSNRPSQKSWSLIMLFIARKLWWEVMKWTVRSNLRSSGAGNKAEVCRALPSAPQAHVSALL